MPKNYNNYFEPFIGGVAGFIVGSLIETRVNDWIELNGILSGFRWEITSFKY